MFRYGLGYKIQVPHSNETVEIRDLLTTLYEKAIEKKNWGLVRHSAGRQEKSKLFPPHKYFRLHFSFYHRISRKAG